jgi:Leucine-rich repeat (LRR) protein
VTTTRTHIGDVKSLSHSKVRSFSDVTSLFAYNPAITFIPKSIGEFFPKLRILRITKSSLRYTEYRDYKNLKHLHTLDLSWNKIERVSQCAFQYIETLVKLNLNGNQILALNEKTLMELPLLEEFSIRGNNITHLDFETFQNNLVLREIDMSDNLLEVIEVNFQTMKSIKVINFQGNECIDMKYECCTHFMDLLTNITAKCRGPELC